MMVAIATLQDHVNCQIFTSWINKTDFQRKIFYSRTALNSCIKEAFPTHELASSGLRTHSGAIYLLPKQALLKTTMQKLNFSRQLLYGMKHLISVISIYSKNASKIFITCSHSETGFTLSCGRTELLSFPTLPLQWSSNSNLCVVFNPPFTSTLYNHWQS